MENIPFFPFKPMRVIINLLHLKITYVKIYLEDHQNARWR